MVLFINTIQRICSHTAKGGSEQVTRVVTNRLKFFFIFLHFLLAIFIRTSKRKFRATSHRRWETDRFEGQALGGAMRVNGHSFWKSAAPLKDAAPH
jgi:hypothetical protein